MNKKMWSAFAGLCGVAALALGGVSAAHAQEIKPKPPMYSYVANWQVPRANWPDVGKALQSANDVLAQAQADGIVVGHGTDTNLIHQLDAETHDLWWSTTSLANAVKALDRIHAASDPNSAALNASKHWDNLYVSHYYNWTSGSYKGAYTHVGVYKLKADAPDDALDTLAQQLIVPLLEKQLASGAIIEYEIDTLAIHTEAPGTFAVVYLTPTPEGLDTVQAAVHEAVKAAPLFGQAFDSVTDDSGHRDELLKSDGVYK
ncbi:MAG: hypothetical protein ACLQG3_14375 [Terracidiphilus sp.]